MDRANIIRNLAIPYLCITAKTSSKECLFIHEDFTERMTIADEKIEIENECIHDFVTRIKTSTKVCCSELSKDAIMEDFCTLTESILKTETPVLMSNATNLMVEYVIYVKKVVPSVLSMSEEEWIRFKTKIYNTVQNVELWTISCLKIYEHDFEMKLFLENTVFETYYSTLYSEYMYIIFLRNTIAFNNRPTDMIKYHRQYNAKSVTASEKCSRSKISVSFLNKLNDFKDLEEVICNSGTDECPICLTRCFTSPETRFIINGNPDCRHIICSYCMYNCVFNYGIEDAG